MNQSKVIVSIVTYKSREFIEQCLSTLIKQDYPKHLYKIVISDNDSQDGTLDVIRNSFPSVEIIENKANLGFAGGHNLVFEKAKNENYEYVVVSNYDTVFEENWLTELVKTANASENFGSVQAKMLLWPEKNKINSCGNMIHYLGFGYTSCYQRNLDCDACKDQKEIAYPSGASVLFKVALLKKIGGFNESMFAYHEDTDLGWRIRLAGYKNVLSNKAIMYHKYEFSKSISKYFYIERNRLLLLLQNYRLWTLLLIFPIFIVMEFGLLLFAIRNGWLREKIKSYLYFLKISTWKNIFRERKNISNIRQVSDRKIIQLFSDQIVFQDVSNPLLNHIGNPILSIYWKIIKIFII